MDEFPTTDYPCLIFMLGDNECYPKYRRAYVNGYRWLVQGLDPQDDFFFRDVERAMGFLELHGLFGIDDATMASLRAEAGIET